MQINLMQSKTHFFFFRLFQIKTYKSKQVKQDNKNPKLYITESYITLIICIKQNIVERVFRNIKGSILLFSYKNIFSCSFHFQ